MLEETDIIVFHKNVMRRKSGDMFVNCLTQQLTAFEIRGIACGNYRGVACQNTTPSPMVGVSRNPLPYADEDPLSFALMIEIINTGLPII